MHFITKSDPLFQFQKSLRSDWSLSVKPPDWFSKSDGPNVSYDWLKLGPVDFMSHYPGYTTWAQQYDWFTLLGPDMIDYLRPGPAPTRVGPTWAQI